MAAPKRTPTQRAYDLTRITEMYLKGRRQVDIAAELGVTQQQVSYDIQEIHRRWRESDLINIGEAKQRELDRIDELERTYWNAWEKSCGERKRTKQETSADGKKEKDKGRIRASVETEQLLGNPAYLAGIDSCVDKRCKVLGLYAPTKVAPTTPDGDEPYDNSFTEAERIARLAAILDAARDRRDRQADQGGQGTVATAAGATD